MRQDNLERAVARATGDDFATIRRRGFSIVDEASALKPVDLEEIVRDWERIQEEIAEHDRRDSHWIVRAPHARNSNSRRPNRSRAGNLSRTTKAAN